MHPQPPKIATATCHRSATVKTRESPSTLCSRVCAPAGLADSLTVHWSPLSSPPAPSHYSYCKQCCWLEGNDSSSACLHHWFLCSLSQVAYIRTYLTSDIEVSASQSKRLFLHVVLRFGLLGYTTSPTMLFQQQRAPLTSLFLPPKCTPQDGARLNKIVFGEALQLSGEAGGNYSNLCKRSQSKRVC